MPAACVSAWCVGTGEPGGLGQLAVAVRPVQSVLGRVAGWGTIICTYCHPHTHCPCCRIYLHSLAGLGILKIVGMAMAIEAIPDITPVVKLIKLYSKESIHKGC